MNPTTDAQADALTHLGWSAFERDQMSSDDAALTPARISTVNRRNVGALTATGPLTLVADPGITTASFAVGDWVLCDTASAHLVRRLDRRSLLQRGAEFHSGQRQLIAANLDTLFVVTSCNADFNVARLERYLALAHDAGILPAIVLTKADQSDAADYIAQARALGPDLPVIALNAKGPDVAALLAPWCGPGQTVALVGSSGVGKTTLANALTGRNDDTQAIREDDARGRHTTTKRSLHALPTGGWLIDTPGMRGLAVADVTAGIDATFPEISALTGACRFRDCLHGGEPGCAVQAAVDAGDIDPERLRRYRKLRAEDAQSTESIAATMARKQRTAKSGKPPARRGR
ncbi:ribosome biogenesis GTPase [Loktanella fryxellensis]|uniref:Small ribosomal subunit biogenesis GTPase RsgA n=1 Tax=Loktanella fryxellensis TaxID=245187 RepID=A0A1H8AVU2_9RHOB|nr:ribosome small subunit-dependent GTPase A [Loktanella fryxellensis]SEM74941.1 ribosome biogenesis GTPase [Loktanella fryxellensis]